MNIFMNLRLYMHAAAFLSLCVALSIVSPAQNKPAEMEKGKKDKKGIISEFLPWLLIAVAILVVLMITIFILRGQGTSLIDKIKGLFGR